MVCFGKHYEPTEVESCFKLFEQRKIGFWGMVQTIFFLLSIILLLTSVFNYVSSLNGESGSIGTFLSNVGGLFWIGIILLLPSFIPGGFGLYNIYRCGDCYLTFDLGTQCIYTIQGHWYNITFKKEKLCPFDEFKGMAKLENKSKLLLLCKSHRQFPTDSLLLHTPKEKYICFGGQSDNGKLCVIMENISKYWMANCTEYMSVPDDPEKEVPMFFGVTKRFTKPLHVPNGDGTYSEVNVNYDYTGYDKDNSEKLDIVDRRRSAVEQMKVVEHEHIDADGDSIVDEVGVERDIV